MPNVRLECNLEGILGYLDALDEYGKMLNLKNIVIF